MFQKNTQQKSSNASSSTKVLVDKKATADKANFPKMEEEILAFWQANKIFEKSVEKNAPKGDFVFYDGPPFATGLPHYGHIVASAIKDIVPRYKTMQGYKVNRKWGWDCHGLPVENLIEKEMGLKSKKDIEELGVDKFNEACEVSVMRYADEWKRIIPRMGRWVDMENDYRTMEPQYMESIWWVFKQLYKKGLIYEGYKSMHLCPRCETTLSNFEVTQGYKDVKDLSVIAKFKLKNKSSASPLLGGGLGVGSSDDVYFLAWTTTPWTLPGNVALAVGEDVDYVVVGIRNQESGIMENYILAKNIFEKWKEKEQNIKKWELYKTGVGKGLESDIELLNLCFGSKILKNIKGKDLVGLEYEPLFPYFAGEGGGPTPSEGVGPLQGSENGWKVYSADFVTTDEGTGIVHIAPAFGDDDMKLGKENTLPFIQHVKTNGQFVDEMESFAGLEVKPKDDPSKTDVEIIKWLAHNGKLFHKEPYRHSYPHCWRCDTPLLNYATSSWFVEVEKIKDKIIKNNKDVNWLPEHLRDGRFGKWLENARDWAISRNRYWGAPLPVWKCCSTVPLVVSGGGVVNEGFAKHSCCDNIKVIGSIEELEKLSGQKVKDLHKQFVDNIEIKCEKCNGTMKRIPEVLDCWFESGSMPYAQKHYLGKPLEDFDPETENNFPAEFIAEGLDQTRGWFYTLMVLSTALFDKPAFKNVVVNGIVLAEDGQKMSKRLKNYPDPTDLISKYGADAMRYYLVSSPVVKAGDLNFSEKGVAEVFRKITMLLWNVYSFYETFADQLVETRHCLVSTTDVDNVLDKWILAKLNLLIKEVTQNLDNYDLQKASRPILEFINELSTWYIRRSRDRFKGDNEKDKQSALKTTHYVLLTLSKIMAPFTPFVAESLFQKLCRKGAKLPIGSLAPKESVHLEEWPRELKVESEELKVVEDMNKVRKIVELGLATRDDAKIKVRQILSELRIKNNELSEDLLLLIKEEVNIKTINNTAEIKDEEGWFKKEENDFVVLLNANITPELEKEGQAREIVRTINLLRKDLGLSINDTAKIYYTDNSKIKEIFDAHGEEIKKDTLCTSFEVKDMDSVENKKEIKIDEEKIFIGIV